MRIFTSIFSNDEYLVYSILGAESLKYLVTGTLGTGQIADLI